MSGAIYLVGEDDALIEMREQPYDSEAVLQKLLADHPRLLGDDNGGDVLLVSSEVAVSDEDGGAGRLDHLFIDHEGVPVLVEVKRASDTRIRREVVGQLLDYAANAVLHWPAGSLRTFYEARCSARATNPVDEVALHLGEDVDYEQLWEQVKTNLQAGRVRLIFIADRIPSRLRRIVEFLNQQMDPAEVLALEIQQYVGERQGVRTLVPRVIGQTAGAHRRKSGSAAEARQWDEASFFAELERQRGSDETRAARVMYEFGQKQAVQVWFGKGKYNGSFAPIFSVNNTERVLFICYTYGSVEIHFQWLAKRAPFDEINRRLELMRKLNAIPEVKIAADRIDKRPSVPLARLVDPSSCQAFLDILQWLFKELRETEA